MSSHASGRRSGDQFCVYVCDRLVLTTVRDRIDDMAAGGFLLDGATRHYVRAELGFRIVEVTDGREALQVERRVQRGELAAGRPASQSARLGLLALLWEGGGDKLGLFMQAGEAGPDILRLGLDGDEAVEQHCDGIAGLDRFVEHLEALTTEVSNKPRRKTRMGVITAWRSEQRADFGAREAASCGRA